MFDFFFKRATKPATAGVVASPPTAQKSFGISATSQTARGAARAQAEKITDDEAACVEFLLTCDFADARLIAAQAVHSRESLQRVLKSVRNSDRRVARLMQSRLDELQTQNKVAELASQCVDDAKSLTLQPHLTAQKVAEIDRRWAALVAPPSVLQNEFNSSRSLLGERLVHQAQLQRKLIDTLASLRRLADRTASITAETLHTTLVHHEADIALWCASIEAVNVPKNLFEQCKVAANAVHEVLTDLRQREEQSATLISMLDQWEEMAPALLNPAAMQRDWQRAIGAIDVLPEMQTRWAALLALVADKQPPKLKMRKAATPGEAVVADVQLDQSQTFATALQALDSALAQGSLQHAQNADRLLRANSTVVPTTAQTAHLSRLRAQLSQLQSWARWGGNISREELQKAALALPEQALTVVELAKKIGNLRRHWKALDATSGPAPKELWQSFDAACTAAYAPVAEHHRGLDEARRTNSEAAQRQIAAIEQAADLLAAQQQPDWKAIAQHCQRAQQEWQRIGPTERRDKQALDRRFQTALQRLLQPLGEVQRAEQALREQLIEAASELSVGASGTLEAIRTLQQQWQLRANAVPLNRRIEQALWLRFRAACDAVFAQRKESAAAEDQQRQANLNQREALCLALERSGGQPTSAMAAIATIATMTTILRDSAAAWNACGPVSRALQEPIEKRYRHAVSNIKTQIDALQRGQADAYQKGARQKIQLCVQLESALINSLVTSDDQVDRLVIEWEKMAGAASLTIPSTQLDMALAKRFEQGLQAHRCSDHSYTEKLLANQSLLHGELLRLEIVLALDSPPQLARERLRLQVEVLQAALRDGQAAANAASSLAGLCALPAAVDTETAARLEKVVARLLG